MPPDVLRSIVVGQTWLPDAHQSPPFSAGQGGENKVRKTHGSR